jgi:hypothetical protein
MSKPWTPFEWVCVCVCMCLWVGTHVFASVCVCVCVCVCVFPLQIILWYDIFALKRIILIQANIIAV